MSRSLVSAALAASVAATCSAPAEVDPPKLTVVLVVDQMRQDYLTRFGPLFKGGLGRLLDQGLIFTNAHQDHAVTNTAPGHATVATGVFPAKHGIVSNEFMIRSERARRYAVGDDESPVLGVPDASGRSPALMLRDGLADWVKTAKPSAIVASLAIKDRSAITMGGRTSDLVYWYHDRRPGMVTSQWYGGPEPGWFTEFDAAARVASHYTEPWTRALPEEEYAGISREDAFEGEGEGWGSTFPYDFTELFPPEQASADDLPPDDYFDDFPYTPFADQFVLEMAREAIRGEGMGADDIPDLLMLGLSAADYIGHRWGPQSQEVQDYYIRLDGWLDEFFSFLDAEIGEGEWALALTADHGVGHLPEYRAAQGDDARRLSFREARQLRQAAVKPVLEGDTGVPRVEPMWFEGLHLFFEEGVSADDVDPAALARLREALADAIETLDFIEAAYTRDEIEAADLNAGDVIGKFRRSYHPDRSADVLLQTRRHYSTNSTPANHGTPHDYDTHVPLVFLRGNLPAGVDGSYVRTVDIAPTVAAWMGVTSPDDLDGIPLIQAIQPAIR